MPAKGKHRRPRNNPLTRGFVAAGTGGAALALPLMGATGAHAAERSAPAAAPAVAPVKAAQAQAQTQAQAPAAPASATYRVVAGDHLTAIADEHRVDGGWQGLYEKNRDTIGDDPSMIHPGLELAIGGASEARADRSGGRESAPAAAPEKTPGTGSGGKGPAGAAAPQPEPAPAAEQPAPEQPAGEAQGSSSGYTSPVASGGVTTSYRATGSMWSSGYHTGVDFAAPTGTSVRSVGPGTVVSAGWSGAYGNEVVVQHTDGTYGQYAHLSSLSVSAGQSVSGGTQLGLSGSTGNSSGPHLHFEIRTTASYGSDIDPVAYLRQHGVSL
ncbi:M23 family metallopeptidase [Streptomyces sp. NPDC001889]